LIFQDSIATLRNKARAKIFIKVSDPKKAKAHLLAKGYVVKSDHDVLICEDMADEQVATIISILVYDGLAVYRVEEKRKSLEDIFLDLTSEGGTQHASSSAS
jgi:ABC-type multidrug transport system ATPase subunit